MKNFLKNAFGLSKRKNENFSDKKEYVEPTEIVNLGVTYKIGDRIICRSNEPGNLDVGVLIGFDNNEGKWSNSIPMYKSDITGKSYLGMGIIRHFSKSLVELLNTMSDLEQYNFLSHAHSQISEKYGNKIPTFGKLSVSKIENDIITFSKDSDIKNYKMKMAFNTSNCEILSFSEKISDTKYKISDFTNKNLNIGDTLTIMEY